MNPVLIFFAAMLGLAVLIIAEAAILTWALTILVKYTGSQSDD